VEFGYIDRDYSGREITVLPDAVVVHDSAHGKQRQRERSGIKNALRAIERRLFRTGRTRARKHQLQPDASVLLREDHALRTVTRV
jgi:hypothetical protein